ncbi:PKD domain-containing protein [Sediminibacterium ginsengisoli]|uniref:Gliding motility-associated C-terminal domain-containing protein n=1 Tax=Sediminibacterium ginsengisoli TaxID=413434 RepID=A0A1T4RSW1_9BACT|nr:PKD domain-containing protein [Sediminibacterium ginsengisoli]SKA19059.1 gliding motility-associated C-terminal domain-containing protein [Sediminibacterium ginsengisoli]
MLRRFTLFVIFTLSIFHLYSQCPSNLNFEEGNLNNWVCKTGMYTGGRIQNLVSPPLAGNHTIINKSSVGAQSRNNLDYYGNFPMLCPNGDGNSVKLGNEQAGYTAATMEYTITIPATANVYSITYWYAVVLEDGGHSSLEQPKFTAKVFDNTNSEINCASFTYVSTSGLSGFMLSSRTGVGGGPVYYKSWTPVTFDLSGRAGQTVKLEFTAEDCGQGGHFGYAYVDVASNCGNPILGAICPNSPNLTLKGPDGFQNYTWSYLQNGTKVTPPIGTGQIVTITPPPAAGTEMQLDLIPFPGFGCAYSIKTEVAVAAPPSAVIAGDVAMCVGGSASLKFDLTGSPPWIVAYKEGNTLKSFVTGVTPYSLPVSPAATTTYTLVSVSDVNCTNNTSGSVATVTVNPLPTAFTVQGTGGYCTGSTVGLPVGLSGSAADVSYQLLFNNTATGAPVGGTGNNFTFGNFLNAGNYTVNATNNITGCKNIMTGAAVIRINPLPVVSIAGNATICAASPLTLNGNGALNYEWSSTETNQQLTFSAYNDTTITVKGTDINGCSSTATKKITVYALPAVTINGGGTLPFCAGDMITLDATTSAGSGTIQGYRWLYGKQYIAGAVTPAYTTNQPGLYNLELTNSFGCKNVSPDAQVNLIPLPVGNIAIPANATICDHTSLPLIASGGVTGYQWLFNGNIIPGATNAQYDATEEGTYSVSLKSSICAQDAGNTIFVTVLKKPVMDFSYNSYCINVPANFNNLADISRSGPVSWAWDFGDGGTTISKQPVHVFRQAIQHAVKLTATPLICPALEASVTKQVNIEAPAPGIRYDSKNAVMNEVLPLSARGFGKAYEWSPRTGLSDPNSRSPIYKHLLERDFKVAITNPAGCVTVDSILVRIFRTSDIMIAKAFTPNGDGANDKLFPFTAGVKQLIYFRIFNRWGQLMFETTDISKGWDGTANGKKQPMDTYNWIAQGITDDGKMIQRTGNTLLIR